MPSKTVRPEMYWDANRELYRKRVKIGDKWHDVRGASKESVRQKVKELEKQQEAGLVINDNTSLLAYIRQWYPVRVAGLKNPKVYSNAVNAHIAPFFQNIPLRDIRPLHIKQFMASRAHLSKSMQQKNLYTLNQIFRSAITDGLIGRNPCDGITAGGAPAKVKAPLTQEQQQALIHAAPDMRSALFVLLCLQGGLRREEALGLTWHHVHLDTEYPYIDVRNTVTFDRTGRGVLSDVLKSKAARRSIPITEQQENALVTAKADATSVFVVPSAAGVALSEASFRRMWDRIRGGVNFDVVPHQLRHTYITELCASGLDIKKIQYLAGHEDVKMTMQIYAHVINNTPAELGAIIRGHFRSGSDRGSAKAIET